MLGTMDVRSPEEMDRDEQYALKLDAEYIEYLAMIRPFMEAIPDTAQEDVQQCRIWLHRLTNSPASDRYMRNVYMAELCKQLQEGKLQEPFLSQPPTGPFQPRTFPSNTFQDDDKDTSSMGSEVTDTTQYTSVEWQTIREGSSINDSSESMGPTPPTSPHLVVVADHSVCLETQRHLEERIADLQGQVTRCQRAMDYCVMNGKSKGGHPRIDDMETKLSALYEKKLQSMVSTVDKLKQKNEFLNKEVEQYKSTLAVGKSSASNNVTNLNKEITSLVQKIDELEKIKTAMESNRQEMETEHKLVITSHLQDLNRRLKEAETTNQRLEETIEEVTAKSKDLEDKMAKKEEEINHYWQEKLLLESRNYQEQLNEIESKLSSELTDSKNHNEELTKLVDTKNKEISRLNGIFRDQCIRMNNEMTALKKEREGEIISNEKINELKHTISSLRKTIKKHESSKEKYVNDYERRILETETKMESLLRTLYFENSTQKAKLAISLNKGELDCQIKVLEERYKQLFDDMMKNSLKQRQEDLKKINELEERLLSSKLTQTCKSLVMLPDKTLPDGNCVNAKSVDAVGT